MKTKILILAVLLLVIFQQSFANILPTVSIAKPLNNSTFNALEKISIVANASDSDGKISKVDFYVNTTKVGTQYVAPYEIDFPGLPDGDYVIYAVAYDLQNGSSIASVNIKVGVPAVQAPYGGTAAAITGKIQAENFDTGGNGVAYYDGTTSNRGGSNYRSESVDIQTTNDTDGGYNIGWITTGEWLEYTVKVDTTGKYTFKFRVAAPSTGKKMHLEIDGQNISGTINIPSTGSFSSWTTANVTGVSLTQGEKIIRLVMDTDAFNINYFQAVRENQAPAVSITNPLNGNIFDLGKAITLQANATDSDGTISKVEFYKGTTKLGEDLTAPYTYSWTSTATGAASFTAKAIDNNGASALSASVSVSIAKFNKAPVISITSPLEGSSFTQSTLMPSSVTINTSTSDDGKIVKVEFYNGSVKLGTDLTSPFTFSTSFAAGTHSITAKATDDSGAVATSPTVNFTVVSSECILSTVPPVSDFVLSNSSGDAGMGSRLENTADELKVLHRISGKHNIWLTQIGKTILLETGKQYTISFDVKCGMTLSLAMDSMQITFPDPGTYYQIDYNFPPYPTPPHYQVLNVEPGFSTSYVTKTITFTPKFTRYVNIAFNLMWPWTSYSDFNSLDVYLKNISICDDGVTTIPVFRSVEPEVMKDVVINHKEIIFNSEAALPLSVDLFDVQGKKISSYTGYTNQAISIDQHLSPGTYIINGYYGDQVRRFRYVKQE